MAVGNLNQIDACVQAAHIIHAECGIAADARGGINRVKCYEWHWCDCKRYSIRIKCCRGAIARNVTAILVSAK